MNNNALTNEVIGYLLSSGFKWIYETRDFRSVRKNISIHGRITPEEYINLPIIWRKSNMLEIKFINNKLSAPSFDVFLFKCVFNNCIVLCIIASY